MTPSGERKAVQRWESCRRRALLLPDQLGIEASITPEERRRGIYRVRVYTAEVAVDASFDDLAAKIGTLTDPGRLERIDWADAVVGFGVSDPRGIVEIDGGEVGGRPVKPRPGTTIGDLLPRGFHIAVEGLAEDRLDVRQPLVIRGSDTLSLLPLGATTRGRVASSWPHPSFVGDILPASREITAAGFTGEWTVPLLNRSYPQAWVAGRAPDIHEVSAGVRLFEPVALYDSVTRAVKYGLLFIALTFLTLGLVELVTGVRLSLVQYLLIGLALALFFLILIALAEHMGFAVAYFAASATVVVINTAYCASILPRRASSLLVGGVLAAIYGVLYTILKAEDYALLGGTGVLVVALVVTMFLTRKIHHAGSTDS